VTTTRVSIASEATTVGRAFEATAERLAGRPALRSIDGRICWTWSNYADRVREVAAGLSGLGVSRGDVLACWLSNRPEFHVVDVAGACLGAATCSLHAAYTVDEAAHALRDAGSHVLVAEEATLARARAVRARGDTSLLRIVVVDEVRDASAVTWAELPACAAADFDLDRHLSAVEPDDVVTVVYTPGVTGPGRRVTHHTVLTQVESISARLGIPDGASTISWLPMGLLAERLCSHYVPITHGWDVTSCEDPRAIGAVLADVHPHVFLSPPQLWEKWRRGALASPGLAGQPAPETADATAVLLRLGLDRIRAAVLGAGPCPPDVTEYWHSLGIELDRVPGLSETAIGDTYAVELDAVYAA
jgi:long-subunit acyl-CoA synthetase (AMP-forming)